MEKKKINQKEKKSLSGEEVLMICDNKAKMYTYPELVKFNNIDDLLKPYGAIIILYLTKENYGHFCCIFKQNKTTISFFDSYGYLPDDQLKFAPMHFRKSHDQYYPHLTYLMYNSNYKIDYNNHVLQSSKKDIATCGRWTGVRILLRNLTNDEFADLFLDEKIKPDSLVTALTAYL